MQLLLILAGLFQHGDKIGVDPLTYPGIKTAAKMLHQLIAIKQEDNEIMKKDYYMLVKMKILKVYT